MIKCCFFCLCSLLLLSTYLVLNIAFCHHCTTLSLFKLYCTNDATICSLVEFFLIQWNIAPIYQFLLGLPENIRRQIRHFDIMWMSSDLAFRYKYFKAQMIISCYHRPYELVKVFIFPFLEYYYEKK